MVKIKGRRGPAVEKDLGELKRVTLKLDELTLLKLTALGKNRSRAVREATRVAYDAYQAK